MNETQLLQLWNSYNTKLEACLTLSRQQAVEISHLKVRSLLHGMKPIKLFTIIIGVLWVGILDIMLIHIGSSANLFFVVSAGLQSLITSVAIGVYVYQWVLIQTSALDEPVMAVQQRIAGLVTSTLWVTRILFLQLPVWTTFYLTMETVKSGSGLFWLIQVPVTLIFTIISIWLFINIRFEHRHQKWFRWIFSGNEWTPLMKAMDLIEEANQLKSS